MLGFPNQASVRRADARRRGKREFKQHEVENEVKQGAEIREPRHRTRYVTGQGSPAFRRTLGFSSRRALARTAAELLGPVTPFH